jgi:hypothetical protein
MALNRHSDVRKILIVKDVGPIVRDRFKGSLHVFADESARAGIQYPHGLWYIGPLNRGIRHPVDESRLEVVFDDDSITLADVQAFLSRFGIDTILDE